MGQKLRQLTLYSIISLLSIHSTLFGSEKLLFTQKSKDQRVSRIVLSNGDFCQVRHYTGDEHQGLRVVYFVPERSLDENELRNLIQSLIFKYCGKREVPLLTTALKQFKRTSTTDQDHWFVQVKDPDYSECFIAAHWQGESITVEIKYYQ